MFLGWEYFKIHLTLFKYGNNRFTTNWVPIGIITLLSAVTRDYPLSFQNRRVCPQEDRKRITLSHLSVSSLGTTP